MANNVTDINSGNPFHNMAMAYYDAGWMSTPIKKGLKEPLRRGLTGHKNEMPTGNARRDKIIELLQSTPRGCNIAIWLDDGVVGIDVDDYPDPNGDPDKAKTGATKLKQLERQYGKLPDTWISTARADGVSGIRFFKTPKGLHWSGKAGDDIDIIQAGHRYAVCYPSYHPNGKKYYWYAPLAPLDGKPHQAIKVSHDGQTTTFPYDTSAKHLPIPIAPELPELPDTWVDFLTRGRVTYTELPIDMESTGNEILAWAKKHFRSGKARTDDSPPRRMCKQVRNRLAKITASIASDASSHDKIVNGHWSLLNCGIEGHFGVLNAVKDLEKVYVDSTVKERGKRGAEQARLEIFRSKIEGLRKIKGKVDEQLKNNIDLLATPCACFDPSDTPKGTAQGSPVPTGRAEPPSEYALTDDGNAAHMAAWYKDCILWLPDYEKWMYWNGDIWQVDSNNLIRRCFWTVRAAQEEYAKYLWEQYRNLSEGAEKEDRAAASKLADKWTKWAEKSGNYRSVSNALDAVKNIEGVTVPSSTFDSNSHLLGVKNGVIELLQEAEADPNCIGFRLRQAKYDDYVVSNTNVDWVSRTDQVKAGGDSAKGVELWEDYLDTFLPDKELRHFVQKTFGYGLLGANPERLIVFLIGETSTGKSTILNAVMAALGNYAVTVNLGIFKDRDLHPERAQALPKRIITANETSARKSLHGDSIKQLVSNDQISVELKGSNDLVHSSPHFTAYITGNTTPKIEGADDALNRRLLVIPFRNQVHGKDDVKGADARLTKYSSQAVLAWLVEGWVMYAQEMMDSEGWPKQVKEATGTFADELSDVRMFVQECTHAVDMIPGAIMQDQPYVSRQAMFDAYSQRCSLKRMPESEILSENPFSKEMSSIGYPAKAIKIDGHARKVYLYRALNSSGVKVKNMRGA